MADVIVVGAGVAGLGSALTMSRAGHRVTLLERDATPLPADPHGAFAWDRRGAPQVRHSHALLALLRNLLRDHYPDVLAELLAAGATEMDFVAMMPEGMDRTRIDGDEDLVALACRRTTFEWVLRRMVLAEPHVTLRDGVAVTGFLTGEPTELPLVNGVSIDTGDGKEEVLADIVVAANGRRSAIPEMVAPFGVTIEERIEDTGIVYYSRFFHLSDGAELPDASGPIGGDLGYLKYGVFVGDNRTFSITMASQTGDRELRNLLLDPEVFLSIAAEFPATAPYVEAGRAEPLTDVNVMAGLLNRERRFTTSEGEPLVLGLHAVGDAHTCTNPLYGRGCSLAVAQAQLIADATATHGLDHLARARGYEAASREQIHPWYRAATAQDAANRADAERRAAIDAGELDPADAAATEDPMRALLRDGLLPAVRLDPMVFRAFLRMFNLLESPDSLMTNGDVIARVMQVYQDRDQRPPEPSIGPDRSALFASLALSSTAVP